jgi:RNA polymerase sigma-70 factor (ECF subfamily)
VGWLSDRRLAKRIAAGEGGACAELVEAQHGAVYRVLVGLCGDMHVAEDLTQETFTAAWMKMSGFNGGSSLSTWLYRIAYHRFIDWHRRRRSRETVERQGGAHMPKEPPRPLDHLLADEESRRLNEAVAVLEQPWREVIVLHYLQGLSFRQMAEVLDEPSGTVKSRTSQALSRLRTLLDVRSEDGRWKDNPRLPAS